MSRVDEKALDTRPTEQQKARRERRKKQLEQREQNTAANREYRKKQEPEHLVFLLKEQSLIGI